MFKRFFAVLLVAPLLAGPALAETAEEAKNFVTTGVERGITILSETAPDDPARAARFRAFVSDIIDTRSIALFALGHYRKGANADLVRAYVDSFKAYATANYETRLGAYGGQTITVSDATARNDTDMLVKGAIRDAKGDVLTEIAFRVLDTKRGLQLFDVQVQGIWLAVEQRNQFGAFLSQRNGNLQQLIDYLVAETARLRHTENTVAAEG